MKDYTHPDNVYLNSQDDAFLWGLANATYKVRRFTRNRKNKKGKVKIEMEILRYFYGGKGSYNKHRTFVNTNIWVHPKNWNNKTQKLSRKEEDFDIKNNKINQTFAAVQAYIASKGQQDIDQAYVEGVDFSKVRELFPTRKENRKTFYDLMVDYLEIRKVDGDTAPNTIKVFRTVCNRVKGFDDYRKRKTYIEDINYMWSDNFNAWCVGVKNYVPHTIHRTYQVISVCLDYYWRRRDELQIEMNDKYKDPNFKYGKKGSNKPHALTYEQREIVFNHRFDKPYLEKARKMICIQAFTGCRYSDIKLFTPECFKKSGMLIYTPQKTKRYNIEVEQPLHPKAEEIFKEVNYTTTTAYATSNQKYGDYIKEIFTELMKKYPDSKFSDDYSSHNFRDTFISIAVKRGVNFKSILKWSGQKKYETLDVYIDLDDEFDRGEMTKTV